MYDRDGYVELWASWAVIWVEGEHIEVVQRPPERDREEQEAEHSPTAR